MPVPTETLRPMRKMNLIFAVSSIILLLSVAWLIWDDWAKPWKLHQRDALQWQAVVTQVALTDASIQPVRLELAQVEDDMEELRSRILQSEGDQINKIKKELADFDLNIKKQKLPVDLKKSTLVPTQQKIERARLEHGEDATQTRELRAVLVKAQREYNEAAEEFEGLVASRKSKQKELDVILQGVADFKKELVDLGRQQATLKERLNKVQPAGLGAISQKVRNAPLLNWLNPSERIEQDIIPGNRTDLNFITIETADACRTCHFNIDRPEFERSNLTQFLERQLALRKSPSKDTGVDAAIEKAAEHIDFWEGAAERIAAEGNDASFGLRVQQSKLDALTRINDLLPKKKQFAIVATLKDLPVNSWSAEQIASLNVALQAELDRIAKTKGDEKTTRGDWYKQRRYYSDDIQQLIERKIGDSEFKQLSELFRVALTEQFNEIIEAEGGDELSTNSVILGHPRMDLYIGPETAHPLKSFGCSVCHEGSGQETDFNHVAHDPRKIWVDETTGAPVPTFLLNPSEKGHDGHAGHAGHGTESVSTQHDVNLLDSKNPGPFVPKTDLHGQMAYTDPGTGEERHAIPQAKRWEKEYHWHMIHFMEWEKPMHKMEYVESSCSKCHTNHYDVKHEASKFFEGRQLFTQVGCVNCHAVTSLESAKDVKRVGPSLANVKSKLSPEMIASWTWSPKAFRPLARMPHFFMLENNSSPMDILRTRTEVAAISHYLVNASPSSIQSLSKFQQEGDVLSKAKSAMETLSKEAAEQRKKLSDEKTKDDEKAAIKKRLSEIGTELAKLNNVVGKMLGARGSVTVETRIIQINKRLHEIFGDPTRNVKGAYQVALDRVRPYKPELPPAVAINRSAKQAEALLEESKDEKTTEDRKKAIAAELKAIEADIVALKKLPQVGDAKRGRLLFNEIGCLSCHTNLNETGRQWVASDVGRKSALIRSSSFSADLFGKGGALEAAHAEAIASTLASDAVAGVQGLGEARARSLAEVLTKQIAKDLAGDVSDDKLKAEFEKLKPAAQDDDPVARRAVASKIAGQLSASWAAALGNLYYDSLTYNQQHSYAQQNLSHLLNRKGPELSGVGSKLKAGRELDDAQAWVYDWVRNPRHYSSYTIMPSFRLTQQEALDMAAYLLNQERPAHDSAPGAKPGSEEWKAYEPASFALDDDGKSMLDAIAKKLQYSEARDGKNKLLYAGKKLVQHYNCHTCHQINGFEDASSTCANLDGWALKDPHKLAYGYFEHAEEARRKSPANVWKVANEGLAANAPFIKADGQQIKRQALTWEHIGDRKRPWLYHKLHNTRVFDRGGLVIDEELDSLESVTEAKAASAADPATDVAQLYSAGVRKAYDKLKMPKFFLTDEEADAIITFVTSIRKPLVDPTLQQVADAPGVRAAQGAQIASLYNCYGCHNIEGNEVALHKYMNLVDENGEFNYNYEAMVYAPPRLIGQGAKTQPDWTAWFLKNVHPIRPWLKVRMPSFPIDDAHATGIADYFGGLSQSMSAKLEKNLTPVREKIKKSTDQLYDTREKAQRIRDRLAVNNDETNPQYGLMSKRAVEVSQMRLDRLEKQIAGIDNWHADPALAEPVAKLKDFAIRSELAAPRMFSARNNSMEERTDLWKNLFKQLDYVQTVNHIEYPYPGVKIPQITEERFIRGEALFKQLACAKCHPLGDEQVLTAVFKKENPQGGLIPPSANPNDDDSYDDEPAKPATPTTPDAAKPASAAGADDDYGDDDYGDGDGGEAKPAAAQGVAYGIGWSAPNLRYAAQRLQPRWMNYWIASPPTIMPGTKMPPLWPDAVGNFSNSFADPFPPEMKVEMHGKYGWQGPEQRELLIDYLFAAGLRNHTHGAWKLTGDPAPAYDKLAMIPEPKPDFIIPKLADPSGGTDAGPDVKIDAGPVELAATSNIELHDGDQPYAGDPIYDNKTRVVGVVKWSGPKSRPRPVIMSADPACVKANNVAVRDDRFVVNDKGEFQYVLVRVKEKPSGDFAAPSSAVLMDQVGCMYRPHVVAMMIGQPLVVRNSDSTLHNVNYQPKNNSSGNVSQSVKGVSNTLSFTKPELNVPFKCDVHAWMSGRLHVLDHPFFAISDVEGRFEIRGLPPGKYTLETVHESDRVPNQEFQIEVKADTSTRMDVELKP